MNQNETGAAQSGAAELIKRMMKKQLFVIENVCVVAPALLSGNLEAHLRYMIGLEKSGLLFASGPTFGLDGEVTGAGLTIVRAGSFGEAEALAQNDPFVLAGQRRATVRRWIVNEGRISLSVDLSDGTATVA